MLSTRVLHTETVIAKQDVKAGCFIGFDGLTAKAGTPFLGVSRTVAKAGDNLAVIVIGTAVVEAIVPLDVGDIVGSNAQGQALQSDTGQAVALSAALKGEKVKVLLK